MSRLVGEQGAGFEPLAWEEEGRLRILDQRQLPTETVDLVCQTVEEVAAAIRSLAVRGAPLIGVAAAYGLALAARRIAGVATETVCGAEPTPRLIELERDAALLRATRPTAVNLFWAIDRMTARARLLQPLPDREWAAALLGEAVAIHEEDREACRRLGEHGALLIPPGARILTHCNTGRLATGGIGTAAGVIRTAFARDPTIRVYADETRPLLQGARLTAWELAQDGIPVTLLTDGMAAFLMAQGQVDLAIVGADRITANGDVANKVGTYGVAVLARHHGIPCYVAAPVSTFDLKLATGEAIPIEERDPDEVRALGGRLVAPPAVAVYNPAFDVTPAALVSAIVCERGVARAPYEESLARLQRG